jgi:aldehyde dehydrogenase (NAD+)
MNSRDTIFIGGEWVPSTGTGKIEVISPATEQVIATVPDSTTADVDRAVAAARDAFDNGPWPRMSPSDRADIMGKVSQLLQGRAEELSNVIAEEMGTPVSWSLFGQVYSSTMVLDYYTNLAKEFPFEDVRQGMMGPAIVRREAVGVVGAIVPWNVPLFTIMLKLGPALAAGATVVVKPAPETPLDANILAECLAEAGLPKGVVNILPAGREVGEHLVRHPDVDKIAFTGSTVAGRKIASLCGEQLKRYTLELGGKSAAIFLDDADIAASVAGVLPAALMNNGQACVAQTRILASRSKYDQVVDALAAAVGAMKVGEPLDPETAVGPLVADRQRARVEGYIAKGREEGARVVVGGGRPAGFDRGWYVEPTVFADVTNQMTIAREEIFGPVLSVIPYDSPEEAVRIANDSDYGLSGSVWTADVQTGLDIARQVRTGTYTVNGFAMEFSAPFGGFKQSGVGRELGPEGLAAYLESKTINMPQGWTPGA